MRPDAPQPPRPPRRPLTAQDQLEGSGQINGSLHPSWIEHVGRTSRRRQVTRTSRSARARPLSYYPRVGAYVDARASAL